MSPAFARRSMFVLLCSFVACTGSDGASSISDAGLAGDGSHADAALSTLLETDDLRVTDCVELVPSLAYCPTLTLLRMDGTRIDATATDAQISVMSADEQAAGQQCSSLRLLLKYVDGDTRDVTFSPLWRAQANWPSGGDPNFRFEVITDEHGAPSATDDKLCFFAMGPDESVDVPVEFLYADLAVPGTATLQYRLE